MAERNGQVVRNDEIPGNIDVERLFLTNPATEDESMQRLSEALAVSGGTAAILVHPFFPDAKEGQQTVDSVEYQQYFTYQERLPEVLERYRELGFPLILFETSGALPHINETLDRLGMKDGTVFVVETKAARPDPVRIDRPQPLSFLARELKQVGLRRAVVVGSYLTSTRWDFDALLPNTSIPRVAQTRFFEQCVGIAANALNEAQIWTIPGMTVMRPRLPRRPIHQP